jgi:heme oxygenase
MGQESLRSTLRDRTRGLHARLDGALAGPEGQVADATAYLRIVRVMHALHTHADVPLARWAATSPLADKLPAALLPDRADAYAADLTALGADPERTRASQPDDVDDARGLAMLYVLAGSAVGARVLLRGLPGAVRSDARQGLTDAASPAATHLWRATQAVLAQPLDAELCDATVAEACTLFELLLDETELLAS